jgi:putative NADPH-quinone reductase
MPTPGPGSLKISLILANPKTGSFCHGLAAAAAEACQALGHSVRFHNLYMEQFLPLLGAEELRLRKSEDPLVEQHCLEAREADAFIVVHPNWWGQPPAILKGWVDRVFRSGLAYGFAEGDGGEGIPRGLLKARVALVLNTSDTPGERERAVFGDPLELLWGKCIFPLCGVPRVVRHTYSVMVTSCAEDRAAWMAHAGALVQETLSIREP